MLPSEYPERSTEATSSPQGVGDQVGLQVPLYAKGQSDKVPGAGREGEESPLRAGMAPHRDTYAPGAIQPLP